MTMSGMRVMPNQLVIPCAIGVLGGAITTALFARWSVRTGAEVHRMLMEEGLLASGNIPLFAVAAAAAGLVTMAAAVALGFASIKRTELSVHDVDVKPLLGFYDAARGLTLFALIAVAIVGMVGLGGLVTSYSVKPWHVVAIAASIIGCGPLFLASTAAAAGKREVELTVECLAIKALPTMSASAGRQRVAAASEIARKRDYLEALRATGADATVLTKAAADLQAMEGEGTDPGTGVNLIQEALTAVKDLQRQRAILFDNAAPPEAVAGVTARVDEALARLAGALRAQGVDADVAWTNEGLSLPFVLPSAASTGRSASKPVGS